MRLLNLLLLTLIILTGVNMTLEAGPKAVNCKVVSIDETVIQQLKKRISPF